MRVRVRVCGRPQATGFLPSSRTCNARPLRVPPQGLLASVPNTKTTFRVLPGAAAAATDAAAALTAQLDGLQVRLTWPTLWLQQRSRDAHAPSVPLSVQAASNPVALGIPLPSLPLGLCPDLIRLRLQLA
jgi:hypothetical protein